MFERSAKTTRLLTLFRSANGLLSYTAISQHMGEDLHALRPSIINVLRYLERDEGIVFACVRGEGYRRLTDAEKVQSAEGFSRKIRRTAVRGVTRIDAVQNWQALSNEDQLAATLRKAVFEAIQRETAGDRK